MLKAVSPNKPRRHSILPESSEGQAGVYAVQKAPPRKSEKGDLSPSKASLEDNELLTVEEVQAMLKVSEWLVRRLIKDGQLPSVYIGDMARVRVADYREFIAKRHMIGRPPGEPPKLKKRPRRKW